MVCMGRHQKLVLPLVILNFTGDVVSKWLLDLGHTRIVSVPCRIQYCFSTCFYFLCFCLPYLVEVLVPVGILGLDKSYFE